MIELDFEYRHLPLVYKTQYRLAPSRLEQRMYCSDKEASR